MSSIGNSTSQKSSSTTLNNYNKTSENFIRNNKPIKTIEQNEYINGQHKSYYNYNSTLNSKTNSPTTTSGSNTILITHNYSQESKLINKNSNKSSSSITIVTSHNNNNTNNCSNRDINSTTNFDNDNNSGYHRLSMEKMHPILNGNKNDDRVSSPVIVDSINICINNHFNELGCKTTTTTATKSSDNDITKFIKKEKLTDHVNTEPDSTTNHNNNNNNFLKTSPVNEIKTKTNIFLNGMDVLVLKKDEKFYLGTIVAVYPLKFKCLVKFDDGSEYWAEYDELRLFRGNKTNNDDNEPMCVICKKINKNDIVELCERCGRGCHRLCAEGGYNNGIWSCKRCSTENGLKNLEKSRPKNRIELLPYDLNALHWDSKHHVNEEQIYCYCGKTGRWEKKMLQCCKCQQWFHENCIRCLKYPLYNGDRFYIFVCTICNNGAEFVRRLEMKWSDIVHLILFNLTTHNQDKKYHHINKTIVPYAIENWQKLQLQISLKDLSSNEIKENILKTLIIHKNRFKSCREIKKNNSFWGLRSRIPTIPPKIVIPPDINVTEQYIKQNLKINFIPIKHQNYIKSDKISDKKISSDLKFSSEDEIPIKNIIKKDKNYQKNTKHIGVNDFNNVEQKKVHIKQNRKKKVEGESIKKLNLINNKIGKINNTATKKQIIESIYNINSNNFNNNNCDSSDETSSLGTLDIIIPPPKNFQGRNNPFRFTPKKNETNYNNFNINLLNNNNHNINNNFDITSKLVALKKCGGKIFNYNNINEKYLNNYGVTGDFPTAGQFRIVRTVKRRLSAKDLVIGPNKEIKKRRLRRSSGNVEVISTTIQSLPRKANNYMPLIRQEPLITSFKPTSSSLCTNTILSSSSSSSTSSTPLATTPTILESTTINSTAVNLFDSTTTTTTTENLNKNFTGTITTMSRRNLRKREEKNYSENHRRNSNSSISTNCSNASNNGLSITSSSVVPILHSTTNSVIDNSVTKSANSTTTTNFNQHKKNDCSISDLQNSVNMYFGAIERIKNGEKFSVKAKRKLPNGKTQYLVEWDVGGITTMNQ